VLLNSVIRVKKAKEHERVETLAHTAQKKRNGVEDCGLDFFGLKQRFLAGTCEHDSDL